MEHSYQTPDDYHRAEQPSRKPQAPAGHPSHKGQTAKQPSSAKPMPISKIFPSTRPALAEIASQTAQASDALSNPNFFLQVDEEDPRRRTGGAILQKSTPLFSGSSR
jgi:hypothetical protein